MSDFAKRLTMAFSEGKTVLPEHMLNYTSAARNKALDNAIEFVRQNGGEVIRGWILQGSGYYAKHAIVQHNDRLLELTKTGRSPLPFVRHDLFPDDWDACGIFVMDNDVWSRDAQQQQTSNASASASASATKPAKSYMASLFRLLK